MTRTSLAHTYLYTLHIHEDDMRIKEWTSNECWRIMGLGQKAQPRCEQQC